MDRNTLSGLLLLVLFVVGWSVFFADQPQESPDQESPDTPASPTEQVARADSTAPASDTARLSLNETGQLAAGGSRADSLAVDGPDSLTEASFDSLAQVRRLGVFARVSRPAAGTPDSVVVNTPEGRYVLNTKGGFLRVVTLNGYTTEDSLPLPVWNRDTANRMHYLLKTKQGVISTDELYFQPSVADVTVGPEDEPTVVRLQAKLGPNQYLEHQYTFTPGQFDVGYEWKLVGMGQVLVDDYVSLELVQHVPKTERSWDNMNQKTQLVYKEWTSDDDGDVDDLSAMSDEREHEKLPIGAKWVAYKSQFFSAVFIAEERFAKSSRVAQEPLSPGYGVKRLESNLWLEYDHQQEASIGMRMYFGPNETSTLDSYRTDLGQLVDMGWGPIRYISYGILAIFNWLEGFGMGYGLIIFLIALLVKVILWPLTQKSYISQAKMRVVNNLPEIKELNEQYKDEPQELQKRKMAFYTKVGVSPFGGCLPLLLQFPVLIAMFSFFPNAIQLRHEGFLWATDLSTYDSVYEFGFEIPFYGDHVSLFTLLWVVSQLIYGAIQMRSQPDNPGQPKFLRYLPFIMPVIFLGIFNNYSSGLSYYYLLFNLMTIGQTYAIKAFLINEDKMLAEIHENKSGQGKSKRTGGGMMGWMQRQQEKRENLMQERRAEAYGRQGRRQVQGQSRQKGAPRRGSQPAAQRKKKRK